MFSRIIYWRWCAFGQSWSLWYTMFLGCKRVHIESICGCWGYVWSEWKTMNPRWKTVCGAAAAWSVGEHHLFFFNGRACGSWHTWAFPSPASSAVGTHGGLEQAGGWRISGDMSEGGNSPWPNIFSCKGPQIHFSRFIAPFPTWRQNQPCLALAAAACVAGKPRLHWEIRLQCLGSGISP